MKIGKVVFICLLCFNFSSTKAIASRYNKLILVLSDSTSQMERNIAGLLKHRLSESTSISVTVITSGAYHSVLPNQPATLVLYMGISGKNSRLNSILEDWRITPVSAINPGQEGFLLKIESGEGMEAGRGVLAAVDNRGLLYAVGAFLRNCNYQMDAMVVDDVHQRTAPAFEVRGTQYGQSGTALNKAKVRLWSRNERERAILDLALAGANTFFLGKDIEEGEEEFNFLRSFDLMTSSFYSPNAGAEKDIPIAWQASESIGRTNYICPSVPEAYQYLLEECEKKFRDSPSQDFIQFKGGDGGGCECDQCRPYGNIFIRLCEDLAKIIHRYHPQTRIYFTNQKFDNESDEAILNYLNEKPREWLWAWGYGPGSDATTWQPGHRQNHRMDLFRYPGFGPYGLYPKELLHRLPARHKIIYFNEITHWRYAQHGYIQMYPRADKEGNLPPHWSHEIYERRPDQALTMVYDRLTFFAWPKYYHRVFNDLMRYGMGDITHSSGNHDHFNQWMWQRLLWNPRMEVAEVVSEYSATWFGKAAAPLMSAAIFQLESNLEEKKSEPLWTKKGIEEYYHLVEEAGKKIPPHLLKSNWLWRMFKQKGALDWYIKLDLTQQVHIQRQIEQYIRMHKSGIDWNYLLGLINDAKKNETPQMIQLKKEAIRLGEESDQLFGTRSEAVFNLEHDYIGLGWIKRQIERAKSATTIGQRDELLSMITDYEGKESGAIYDNLGTANDAPNVVNGYPYDHGQPYLPDMLWEANRPSQRSMHYTQDEEDGVRLKYRNLKSGSDYRLRLTLVRPVFQERYEQRMKQKSQSVYANGNLLVKDLELPESMSDFFTFYIPASMIRDGELEIKLARDVSVLPDNRVYVEQWRNTGGWGTLLSEAWLIPVKEGKIK